MVVWDDYSKWVAVFAKKYYALHENICKRSGTTAEDLRQEGYFAFLEAKRTYTEDMPHTFISHLRYPLLNAFNSLTGMRTVKGRREPLNIAKSLDTPLQGAEDVLFVDTVKDPEAVEAFLTAEDNLYREQLREIMHSVTEEALTERERDIAYRVYGGETLKAIAQDYNVSISAVRESKSNALRKLRHYKHTKRLRGFLEDVICSSYKHGGLTEFRNTWTSSVEWAVMKLSD